MELRQNKGIATIFGATMLFFSIQGVAIAGNCVIKGQGLVTAYTYAEQEGFESYATFRRKKGGPHRRSGVVYIVPGKFGVKGRTSGNAQKVSAVFFRHRLGKKLKRGWKIAAVQYGGNPTAVGNFIREGTSITLFTRHFLRPLKKFDFYITSFILNHPSAAKKCGNDPVSQQIVLRQAFKGQ